MSTNPSRGDTAVPAGLVSAAFATLGVAVAWGFVVDDAWITARVAWRLANGLGYRFNAHGLPVDAVTPLGWVFLLVPFAKSSVAGALLAARYLGALSWIGAAGWLGYRLRRDGKNPYFAVPLLAAAPLGAWAGSGMETGFLLALCTLALGDSVCAALAAGVAGALRPELVPFCLVLSLRPLIAKRTMYPRVLPIALSAGLPLAVAIVRQACFGLAIPLAAVAKPPELFHGARYALGVLLFLGPTWLWVCGGWKGLSRGDRIIALSVIAHLGAVVAAGGDWMPLWRLAVPVVPASLWVASSLQARQRRLFRAVGFAVALIVLSLVWYSVGIPGRHVMRARAELVERARPVLAGAYQVVALDVGWVGEAFPGEILDLAGVTDRRVAVLPGGHTSKNVKNSWFDSVQPDALVLLTAPGEPIRETWTETHFARAVENRVARMPYWQACRFTHAMALKHTQQSYAVIRCP